jgi:hypothetical protein
MSVLQSMPQVATGNVFTTERLPVSADTTSITGDDSSWTIPRTAPKQITTWSIYE